MQIDKVKFVVIENNIYKYYAEHVYFIRSKLLNTIIVFGSYKDASHIINIHWYYRSWVISYVLLCVSIVINNNNQVRVIKLYNYFIQTCVKTCGPKSCDILDGINWRTLMWKYICTTLHHSYWNTHIIYSRAI